MSSTTIRNMHGDPPACGGTSHVVNQWSTFRAARRRFLPAMRVQAEVPRLEAALSLPEPAPSACDAPLARSAKPVVT